MNLMSELVRLLNENRIEELIAYIQGNEFPPDTYDFEEAHQLREARGGALMLLGDFRGIVEKMGPSCMEDEDIRSIKDSIYEVLATYVDLQLAVVLYAFALAEGYSECAEKYKELEKRACTKMRLGRRKMTIKQDNEPRDAVIHEIAKKSGFRTVNKQADFIRESWDDTELAEFKPLSSDRIRKILAP